MLDEDKIQVRGTLVANTAAVIRIHASLRPSIAPDCVVAAAIGSTGPPSQRRTSLPWIISSSLYQEEPHCCH